MLQLAQAMSRLGTESAFEVLARAKALEAKGKSIINLGIGQPDFLTPPHIVEAAIKALRDGQHGYTPANGIPQLREAVAADLNRRHGVTVDPGCVLIVPGGKVTMFFAILMFGEAGTEIMSRCWKRTASRSRPRTCCRGSRRGRASSSSTRRPTPPVASCRAPNGTGSSRAWRSSPTSPS
jgi:hypothetical protein